MKRSFIFFITVMMLTLCLTTCNNNEAEPQLGTTNINGALPGKFSVSEGRQVYFSKGNLWYSDVKKHWRFSPEQYNLSVPSSMEANKYIFHFGWGTGNNPTNQSTDINDYQEFVDWGVNPILDSGEQPNLWRTLTADEWKYLISSRLNAKELCGYAQVNRTNGLILLPDDWKLPSDVSFNPTAKSFTYNKIDNYNWKKMEEAGAVFLPVVGRRWGEDIFHVNEELNYWASTASEKAPNCGSCLTASKNSSNKTTKGISALTYPYGISVRLVTDVK